MTFAVVFLGIVGIGIAAILSMLVKSLGVDQRDALALFSLGAFSVIVSVFILLLTV